MKSVDENRVFRQYLNLYPRNALACPLLNYKAKKLTNFSLVKIMIIAGISKWESYREIVLNIGSKESFQQELELKSISPSQLCRRLNELNTADLVETSSPALLDSAVACTRDWFPFGPCASLNYEYLPITI